MALNIRSSYNDMKVLHVWDNAGVSCLLALYQRRLGHKADIIMREEYSAGILEYYGLTDKFFYEAENIDKTKPVRRIYYKLPSSLRTFIRSAKRKLRTIRFAIKVMKAATHYDVIHIHSFWIAILFIPFKKKIIHWHGDDCRITPSALPRVKKWITRMFIQLYSKRHVMYVSTPDLLRDVPNATWLPNPVDLELFTSREKFQPNTAFYLLNWYETGSHAYEIAKANKWKLTVLDRTQQDKSWIPHQDFPAHLGQFEFFIDRKEIPSLSKTALEALAMGLKVVQGWDGKVVEGLRLWHHPETCAMRAIQIYGDGLA